MDEAFPAVPDGSRIVRFGRPLGAFLPRGRVLPLPGWLAPNQKDKEDGAARGRPAGLSVWDVERTTVADARALANMQGALAFATTAGACRAAGQERGLAVDVVRDPLVELSPRPAWDAHALVEGLSAPKGEDGRPYDSLRVALVEEFEPAD
jgi:hypothetical protein